MSKMPKCECCKKRKAKYIVYDLNHKVWVFNCPKCINEGKDLVVPPHMIEQLQEIEQFV
jgi:hypothetical protein